MVERVTHELNIVFCIGVFDHLDGVPRAHRFIELVIGSRLILFSCVAQLNLEVPLPGRRTSIQGGTRASLPTLVRGNEVAAYVVRSGNESRCAKVYKDFAQRSFQQRVQYQEGRKVSNRCDAR